jgi:trigger factor
MKLDLDKDTNFEFIYDLGLAPKFDMKISDKSKFDLYKIGVDEKLVEKNIVDIQKRYGKVGNAEKSEANDMIQGDFKELDENGEIKAGGIYHTSTIALEYIQDEKVAKTLIGKKIGDKVTVDPHKVSKGGADTAAMLNVDKSVVDDIKSKFEFEVKLIYRVEPAKLDQELFDKAFGKDEIKSEEELKARVSDEISKHLETDAKRKLKHDITETLLSKTKLSLPDEFLKRWLLAVNEKLTQDQLDTEYEDYAKGLRWQLIQNKIIKENDLKVEHEEVMDYEKDLIRQQMAQYGQMDLPENEMEETAMRVLQNKEEAQRIYEMLYDQKMMELFENTFKLKNKEVTYDEFVKLASEKKDKGFLSSLKNNLKL